MSQVPRIRRRTPQPDAERTLTGIHPLLARLYAARGVQDVRHCQPRLQSLAPPELLDGIDAATALLERALSERWRILVVGDFDCDGAAGSAVAVRGLRLLGACEVGYCVPHRMRHGYGLSPELVDELPTPLPGLLVTVDSGIACHEGVARARALGMRVLVTDHHLPGARLPQADAIVDPNLPGDGFPSKALAGVGVVFYVLLALRARLRKAGWFRRLGLPEPDLIPLLDLVAVGTIADMVPLDVNNRALVAAGLRRIRAGQACAGIRALAEVAGRDPAAMVAADIGFALAPRINAAGRIQDMGIGIDCLLQDDHGQALAQARRLDAINRERRTLQREMLEQADALAEGAASAAAPSLTVFDPRWHPGIVGLVASRLKERWHRPVVAFAPGEDGLLRGSARSVPGLHVRDALADVAARTPGLLVRFGGHAAAAGLTLSAGDLERFGAAFEQVVSERLGPDPGEAELLSDGSLEPEWYGREIADLLRFGGPWGQGFPEPLFDDCFQVQGWRVVGEAHLRLALVQPQHGLGIGAIAFGGWHGVPPPDRVHAAFELVPDDYHGRGGIELRIRHWQPA
ncbi:MAG TPA: single-stranded-DNA-specific exonuclease RecJ [Xanthomonadaceae bacterium]|nr:single-stranded-DNA-specific exonuclease RecJ [Xanthomonadaceae bacterium]